MFSDALVNTYQTCSLPYKGIATSVNSSMTKYAVTVNFANRCEDITTTNKHFNKHLKSSLVSVAQSSFIVMLMWLVAKLEILIIVLMASAIGHDFLN